MASFNVKQAQAGHHKFSGKENAEDRVKEH